MYYLCKIIFYPVLNFDCVSSISDNRKAIVVANIVLTAIWYCLLFPGLNITAIAVAIYEWLSPFGLNPWGRQRSKNFSMSSALWVMWGLLCGHLVAFKAPKSWPNKFLINVWGGFSVIFVASYTANIAALIAGLFFHNTVSNYHDRSVSIHMYKVRNR